MKNNQCNLCGLYFNPMIEKYKLYQNKCKCRTTPRIHDYKMVNGRVVPVSDEGKECEFYKKNGAHVFTEGGTRMCCSAPLNEVKEIRDCIVGLPKIKDDRYDLGSKLKCQDSTPPESKGLRGQLDDVVIYKPGSPLGTPPDEGKELPYPCSPLSQHEISTSPKDEGKCKCRRCILKRKEIASRVTPPETPSRNESWEVTFDKEFPYGVLSGEDDDLDITDETKEFIRSLLASQKAEWERKVEELKQAYIGDKDFTVSFPLSKSKTTESGFVKEGYNAAIDDVLALLKDK